MTVAVRMGNCPHVRTQDDDTFPSHVLERTMEMDVDNYAYATRNRLSRLARGFSSGSREG